jgi:alanyl-tRNA synthetase
MNSKKIRQTFFDFFESKQHKIVSSAPMVNQNDPSLLFTNAGMNQFKDYFLGNQDPEYPRIADTQKCLRVSGKHNDLEEVGLDSYHHTMFEMLGNWSFGDYFKEEAISWAWELLTEVYGVDADRIYVTVFEGAVEDEVPLDKEAKDIWAKFLPAERILEFGKKDNFWEMGDTGPCGPCSEIHVDLRSPAERTAQNGADLVNMDHPLVIEIWNLVFIQYQRMEDGILKPLSAKHVDTGMGFERLCMVLQSKQSNYETDVFSPFIQYLEEQTDVSYKGLYGKEAKTDTAFRVIVDHLRAVSFAIADGAMPSNTGAGYVIRRILRRAVRYYYSFLDRKQPLLYDMVGLLAKHFGDTFPELSAQEDFIRNVIQEEEKSFLKTLADGLKKLELMNLSEGTQISGEDAFELYDTFGFPIDLTRLIAQEAGAIVDEEGFNDSLQQQKDRSRKDAHQKVGDWVELRDQKGVEFVGYDQLYLEGIQVAKYRTVRTKKGNQLQMVLDKTPFYAEGGGQVGDTGILSFNGEEVKVLDTQKENELIIHTIDHLPEKVESFASAKVDAARRSKIENNHSATHLLHAALRNVLGEHVQQKGSLVAPDYLRFDFSHFQKMTDEEVAKVEQIVNEKIRANIPRQEARSIAIEEAKEAGAMMLFGEKYGEHVRMITFDPDYSIELCGGCHVPATGQIGHLRIVSETSVASGVRRIEAVTAEAADVYVHGKLQELEDIKASLKHPKSAVSAVESLQEENKQLKKQIEKLQQQKASGLKDDLIKDVLKGEGFNAIIANAPVQNAKTLKDLAYQLLEVVENAVIVLGANISGKPQLIIAIEKDLTEKLGLHAGNMIRDLASHIKGGGGGQAFFASAGGSDPAGIEKALETAKEILNL